MRIGLTQRVLQIEGYGERRDCLDQAWTRVVESLGCTPLPLANGVSNAETYLEGLGTEALFFTGGNDLGHLPDASSPACERDCFEKMALEWAIKNKIPALGVCRGMQMINHFFGGELCRVSGHAAVQHIVFFEDKTATVNSYHDWAIPDSGLGTGLTPLAFDGFGNVEAFKGIKAPLLGIMWHPERDKDMSDLDRKLIIKLLGINK